MNLSYKTNYTHLFFISLLAIHYALPLIFIGQVTVNPHDMLDIKVVIDHIISNIYNFDRERFLEYSTFARMLKMK